VKSIAHRSPAPMEPSCQTTLVDAIRLSVGMRQERSAAQTVRRCRTPMHQLPPTQSIAVSATEPIHGTLLLRAVHGTVRLFRITLKQTSPFQENVIAFQNTTSLRKQTSAGLTVQAWLMPSVRSRQTSATVSPDLAGTTRKRFASWTVRLRIMLIRVGRRLRARATVGFRISGTV
jgi:hypothetical protein